MSQQAIQQALDALRAVVSVADRATAEFDLARTAIVALEKELAMHTEKSRGLLDDVLKSIGLCKEDRDYVLEELIRRVSNTMASLAIEVSDDCQSCNGSGSGGMGVSCTDCLGTGRDQAAQPEFDRDADGELLIDWSPKEGRMLSLSLRADGRLSYAVQWDGEKAHGTVQMPAIEVNDAKDAAPDFDEWWSNNYPHAWMRAEDVAREAWNAAMSTHQPKESSNG